MNDERMSDERWANEQIPSPVKYSQSTLDCPRINISELYADFNTTKTIMLLERKKTFIFKIDFSQTIFLTKNLVGLNLPFYLSGKLPYHIIWNKYKKMGKYGQSRVRLYGQNQKQS